ncbi:MAG: ASCH domain-containing protein [Bacilli bacterium]|nr:ASCH domain-containing protein [Bacilli bacterium]
MKALTIKEPWASLIIMGYKKYEFRTWKTKYRGKILIHTSQNFEKGYVKTFEKYNLKLKSGYIIGEAVLTDCILVDKEMNDKLVKEDIFVYGNSDHTGIYAWKLENVITYNQPTKAKGKLGIWNYEE